VIFDYETGWDSRAGLQPNLASYMDFAEHERIARNALQLLAGNMPAAQNPAEEKLEQLKEAYEGNDPDDVLRIQKGIHQIPGNPHIQLKLERGDGRVYGGIHLNVSASEDATGLPEEYFHWVGVQFTADANDQTLRAVWPLGAPTRDMRDLHSRRRMSIAPKDIQSKINAIAQRQAQQLGQQRAQLAKQQAQLAQSAKDKARNAERKVLEDKLAGQKLTLKGVKNAGLDNLLAGQTVDVTTKTGKPMKVKYEGGVVKWA
jgi:hypothetical protein